MCVPLLSILFYKVVKAKADELLKETVNFSGYLLNAAMWIFIASLLAVIWID